MNAYTGIWGTRYSLEPGDATRYEFSLIPLGYKGGCRLVDVVTGVGSGENYVQLVIHMASSVGSYEVMKASLRHCDDRFIMYLANKMPHVYFPTLVAIALAGSVLVDNPEAVDKAAEKMIGWREVVNRIMGDKK